MDRTQAVIENALSAVEQARAIRERNLERRAKIQKKLEDAAKPPLYILKKYGGQQMSLKLDS